MSQRKRIIIEGAEYDVGPDIDLDVEEVRLADGTRLTEEQAARLGEEIASRVRGRPSLTGKRQHSPHVSFRVKAVIRERAERRARAEGKSLSQLAREALEAYLDR